MKQNERYTILREIVNAMNIIGKFTTESIETSVIGTLSAGKKNRNIPGNENGYMSVWMSCQHALSKGTRC